MYSSLSTLCAVCVCVEWSRRQRVAQFVMLCPRIFVWLSSSYLVSFKALCSAVRSVVSQAASDCVPMLPHCLAATSASDKWRHSAAMFNIPLVNCPFNHSRLEHPLQAEKRRGWREAGKGRGVWQTSVQSEPENRWYICHYGRGVSIFSRDYFLMWNSFKKHSLWLRVLLWLAIFYQCSSTRVIMKSEGHKEVRWFHVLK